jgi:uncharacterized membrane protein YoaK (UPF0700 family)
VTPPPDRLLIGLLILTVVTGLIDAVSFLGLGRTFTANMTGNVVLLGFAVAGTPRLSVAHCATALVAFLLGAATGGQLGARSAGDRRRRWLVRSAFVEAGLLLGAAITSFDVDAGATELSGRGYAVLVLIALAMGLQTATVRRLAVADLTTTVVTTTLAGMAADSWLGGGDNSRLKRRLGAIVALFGGAGLGAWLLTLGLRVPLVMAAVAVLAATTTYRDLETETPA